MLDAPGATLAGMAIGLALFYCGGSLWPALLGLAIFGALALRRPDLGVLFVPLTAPLYLIPASIAGVRAGGFQLPLHEAALLAVAGAALARRLWRRATEARRARAYAPHALFLLAGILGVLLAAERSRALREFRWLITEPLIFFALITSRSIDHRPQDKAPRATWLVAAFALGGALAGLLGLLQYAGLDLVPLLGQKQCYAPDGGPCANIVADGGVRRALSVYGHPNNLGLYLGRVWPLAAALAIAHQHPTLRLRSGPATNDQPRRFLVFGLLSLVCLGGLLVSFSRGAWLGAVAAVATLALGRMNDQQPTTNDERTHRRASRITRDRQAPAPPAPTHPRTRTLTWLLALGVALAVLAGLALSIRGDVTAGSTPARLLIWREALGYIATHPLGIGLDQFGYYHDPNNGLSLIDPSLIPTSERYAAHPHNLVLDIWLRMGPLGLVAFGWLLALFFRAARREKAGPWEKAIALGAAAALIAALTHGLVDNFYFTPDLALAFWLLVALVAGSAGFLENAAHISAR